MADRRELLIELARAEDELEQVLAEPPLERDVSRQILLERSVQSLKQSLADLDDDVRGRRGRNIAAIVKRDVEWVSVEAQRVELTEKRDRVQAEVSSLRAKRAEEVDLHFVSALEAHLVTLKQKLELLPVPEHSGPPRAAAGTWLPLDVGAAAPTAPSSPSKHPFVKLWVEAPPAPKPFVRLVDSGPAPENRQPAIADDASPRQLAEMVDGLSSLERSLLQWVKSTCETRGQTSVETAELANVAAGRALQPGSAKTSQFDKLMQLIARLTNVDEIRYPLLAATFEGSKPVSVMLTPLGRAVLTGPQAAVHRPVLSAVPNLFMNGLRSADGARIPPHNLSEIAKALLLVLDRPSASLFEILALVHGPDFATGGVFVADALLRDVYGSGRGRLSLSAKTCLEGEHLVFTELPPGVRREQLMAGLVATAKTAQLGTPIDESQGKVTRIVLPVGNAAPALVLGLVGAAHVRQRVPVSFSFSTSRTPTFFTFPQLLRGFVESRVAALGEKQFRARLHALAAAFGDERRTTVSVFQPRDGLPASGG